MKERIINIFKLLFCFSLFIYISDINKFVFNLFGYDITQFSLFRKTLLNVFSSILLLIILIIFYWKDLKKDFKEFKVNFWSKVFFALKIFGIFMLIKFLAGYVSVIISNIFHIQDITSENQNTINELLGEYPILMTFSAVCLAPIYEEILFRYLFISIY